MSDSIAISKNHPLAPYTTFKIGGCAKWFTIVQKPEEMVAVRHYINTHKMPYWILGRGSNSLFDDRGFDGLVVLNNIRFFHFAEGLLKVGAGYNFSQLGSQMSRKGWTGLEFATGIPGTVGGAVYMNAGANQKETCDALVSVRVVNSAGNLIEKKKQELYFSYRTSSFQQNDEIIVSALFRLTPSPFAREKQQAITKKRIETQPYGESTAGCFFRNPSTEEGAGALIEKCGLKGQRVGDAEVSSLHANFIVNRGKARAADVLKLAHMIQKTVHDKTGIELEMEVRPIPYSLKGGV